MFLFKLELVFGLFERPFSGLEEWGKSESGAISGDRSCSHLTPKHGYILSLSIHVRFNEEIRYWVSHVVYGNQRTNS